VASSVTATFVFTDLVDSTATSAGLGPEAAEELRQTHFRLLRSGIAASAGTEVKNLGDGLMVMYSSPSRALAGAVGMQQAIDHHNRSGGQPLRVRMGITVGEAVEEDGDYFGDPVVEAARLCAAAEGGQILASEIVRGLVGRHATQTFVEVGPLELKGLPEPVDTVEVLWEPARVEGSVPLPGRLVGAASDALFGFFGRGPELATVEETRKRAHDAGRSQVVFVAGEAGLGKTALAAQAARVAHGEGAIVLFGHADEDLGVAYQPWIEALSALVRGGDAAVVEGLPSAQRAALARLLPSLSGSGARVEDPDTERLLLLEGTAELLAAVSRGAPVFLVLDDLHWADAASLQLLRHVTAAATPMDLTVVCTYRDTDLSRGNPLNKLLADLYREPNVTRVSLRGLEDNEVIELMEAAAGHGLDDSGIGLAHALRRETDGNPFFTGEILRHLGETGGIVMGGDGRWTVAGELEELGLPNSVRDVIGQRVERLGAETVRVLSLGSVFGREFDVTTLATLADIDEDTLLDLLDGAVSGAVVVESAEGSRYRFAHALIQHTLYDDLSATRRQRMHQRIAVTLESDTTPTDPALLAELARHWIAATRPTDIDKALHYARLAGDAARDALAPDEAIRWYRQALDLLERQSSPDPHQQANLLAALGTAQRQSAQPDYEDALVQAADIAATIDDDQALIVAALGFQLDFQLTGGNDMAKRVLQAALACIGPEPTPTRARLLAELALAHDAGSEWQVRRDLSIEAVDIARDAGDDATFVWVVIATQNILATPDRLDQHVADVEAAVIVADRIGDPALRFGARAATLWAAYQQADIARTDVVLGELQLLADALSLPLVRFQLAQREVCRLLIAGHAREADAANERVLECGTAAGEPQTLPSYGGLMVGIRQHEGRTDELVDLLIQAARDNPSVPAFRSALPAMLCELDRADEARDRFDAEVANGFNYAYDTSWLSAMANVTDAAATLGDRRACETVIERLMPFATQVVAIGSHRVMGALARPLARAAGVLGDYDQAEQWFATAHDIHTRLQTPFWTARGQLDHADLCLTRRADDDLQRARDLATTAAATAAEYGCTGLSTRAANLLTTVSNDDA